MNRQLCEPQSDHCQLCGDDAQLGLVLAIRTASRTATVRFGNVDGVVALDLVDAAVGDTVLVHMGFAIERLVRVNERSNV